MSKRLLVVFGATGNQGGSVVKSILGDPKTAAQFTIRGITRDPSKPAAQALKQKGVEVVTADLNDKASLKAAIKGAYAVFAVTDFWQTLKKEVETQQGKNVADIAKELDVQHLVWSSLPNVTELSKGTLTGAHHFDSKAEVEAYIRSIGVPATFYLPGLYMSNIPGGMMREDSSTHEWVFALPIPESSPVPLLDVEDDTGKFVKGILTHRDTVLGKRILAATEYLTIKEIVEQFKEVKPEAGKKARFIQLPHETYKGALAGAGLPEIAQEDLLQNMRLMPEFGYYGGESLDESHSILDEPLTTWKEYVAKAKPWANLK